MTVTTTGLTRAAAFMASGVRQVRSDGAESTQIKWHPANDQVAGVMTSSVAVRLVMACDEPTATARLSTPVASTNSAAWPGSVRTPGAWALVTWDALPPTYPSSASTKTPCECKSMTARAVAATFLSY